MSYTYRYTGAEPTPFATITDARGWPWYPSKGDTITVEREHGPSPFLELVSEDGEPAVRKDLPEAPETEDEVEDVAPPAPVVPLMS